MVYLRFGKLSTVLLIAALLTVSGSIWFLVRHTLQPSQTKNKASESRLTTSEFTQAQANEIAADVMSGDMTLLKRSVIIPESLDIPADALTKLKELDVNIDASTFTKGVDEAPSIQASIVTPEGDHEKRRIFLVKNNGRWMVSQDILTD